MLSQKETFKKGFTIIELLVVVILVAFLSALVFVVLDPVTRFGASRNSTRLTDATTILAAIHQYKVDNDTRLPENLQIGMGITQIGTAASGCDVSCAVASASACVNLNGSLAKYLKTMPVDPVVGTVTQTGYYVFITNDAVISVGACASENDESIEVSR